MLTKRHILSAIMAASLSLGAISAHAQTANSIWSGVVVLEAQRSITPAEAKSIARKKVPGGKVVDIKRRGDTYSVRVIKKSGQVVDVLIDANTGRVKKCRFIASVKVCFQRFRLCCGHGNGRRGRSFSRRYRAL